MFNKKNFLCLQKNFSGQILAEIQVSGLEEIREHRKVFLLNSYYSVTSFRSEISGEAMRE